MDVNLRHNEYFVQDEAWYKADKEYGEFLKEMEGKSVVLLEFGVGFNTPGIIRYPFEKMTCQNSNAILIRFNREYPMGIPENAGKTISFDEDILQVVQYLRNIKCLSQNDYETDVNREKDKSRFKVHFGKKNIWKI
jgi:hypothetical protein